MEGSSRREVRPEIGGSMSREYCFTVGATLHIHATDVNDMEEKLHLLWELYPDVIVAYWDLVEQYDPETGEVTTEWEES